jgi:hypothetical protein
MHLDQPVLIGDGAINDQEDKLVVVVELGPLAKVLRILESKRMELKTSRSTAKSSWFGRGRSIQKNPPLASRRSTLSRLRRSSPTCFS